MKRLIWITALITVGFSLISAVLSSRSAQRLRTTARELTAKSERLDTDIAQTRQRIAALASDEASIRAAQTHKNSTVAPATARPGPTAAPRKDLADILEADPAARKLFKEAFRGNLRLRYYPLYNAARLTPAQIERFEELVTEAEQDRLDLQSVARSQGLTANDLSLLKMQQQATEKVQAAQKEVLGEPGYQALQQYERQQPLLNFTTGLASLLAPTGTPLTAPQCERLLSALAGASSQYQSGGQAALGTVDIPQVLQQAETILAPAQLGYLKANTNLIELMKLRDVFYREKKTATK